MAARLLWIISHLFSTSRNERVKERVLPTQRTQPRTCPVGVLSSAQEAKQRRRRLLDYDDDADPVRLLLRAVISDGRRDLHNMLNCWWSHNLCVLGTRQWRSVVCLVSYLTLHVFLDREIQLVLPWKSSLFSVKLRGDGSLVFRFYY